MMHFVAYGDINLVVSTRNGTRACSCSLSYVYSANAQASANSPNRGSNQPSDHAPTSRIPTLHPSLILTRTLYYLNIYALV
jgi:hypothetical protein